MGKAGNETDPDVLAAYDAMISGVPGVERKGAAMPYTSVNGNMYSATSKASVIGLRLGKADLAAFLAPYGTGLWEGVPGFFNKEYAAVPRSLLADMKSLRAWFRKSHEYAAGLKPKKTTK